MVAKARCGDRKQEKEIFLLKESFFLLTYFLIGADDRRLFLRPTWPKKNSHTPSASSGQALRVGFWFLQNGDII
jgi:hypothetical protein